MFHAIHAHKTFSETMGEAVPAVHGRPIHILIRGRPGREGRASDARGVVMPQIGDSIVEGTITSCIKKIGEKVQRDEPGTGRI